MGERRVCNAEVTSSSLVRSIAARLFRPSRPPRSLATNDRMADRSILTREERRARREARRAKQREANVGRAKKMHAARVEYESQKIEESDPAGVGVGSAWKHARMTSVRRAASVEKMPCAATISD